VHVIDLCAGIGGVSLGFERAGFRTVAFCELDEGCRTVLEHRWPGVPIYGDVRDRDGLPVSGLVGSGEASGAQRLSELVAVRDPWIVTENVQHTWRKWVPELRRALHALGYASVSLQVSAAEVGARHLRRRIFVVAHPDSQRLWKLAGWWCREGRKVAKELAGSWDSAPRGLGTDDGLPDWTHRRKQLGNAVVPHVAALVAEAIRRSVSETDSNG
jgi:DNA (cytosine-5)-methyltransferase 1